MEKLISSRSDVQSVPESYILSHERRPGKLVVPQCNTIPVIDLGGELGSDRIEIIQQIIKASQEFGFFQLINHGVSEKLMCDVLNVMKELFEMPVEDKASLYSEDPNQSCRLYTSTSFMQGKVDYWRDYLRHHCHPLEEHMQYWPENPTRYREVVGSYSAEVRKLSLWVLDLISEGLGLESGYFGGGLSQVQMMTINHYPPCPDPSLTLGLPKHCDPNLITFLLQGNVHGLQVFKDEQWLAVEPLPKAFVVILGHTLQIISNGKLRSADHRVVTNKSVARTTVTTFIDPSNYSRIQPAKMLLNKCNPPLYKAVIYKDFLSTYIPDIRDGEQPLKRYKLQS